MKNSLFLLTAIAVLLSTIVIAQSQAPLVNVLSLQEGAFPLTVPAHYDGWPAESMLDDCAKSGWACADGHTKNNVFIFELVGPAMIEALEFDTAATDTPGAAAKEISVEGSTVSAVNGFAPLLSATLADTRDNQKFRPIKSMPARWIKLSIKNNYGDGKWCELFSFRALALKPEAPMSQNISGTYSSSYSAFHIRQLGSSLLGCYEYNEGLLIGSIEGRVMKLTWFEDNKQKKGPAVMVFSADGKTFRGFWWTDSSDNKAPDGAWNGEKTSSETGGCPHWSGSLGADMKQQLAADGRTRVYGILFNTDSATIKSESMPVLNEIVKLMKAETAWSLLIEGHTDSTGGSAHNQALSQQRADSVKTYLVASGIAANRLETRGLGQTKPVAGNDSELGRAQNRRVELVKK